MSVSKEWKDYKNTEPTTFEVVLQDNNQVTLAMWCGSFAQYMDVVLSSEQADELQQLLNSRKAV
jgi:hypothetical protein